MPFTCQFTVSSLPLFFHFLPVYFLHLILYLFRSCKCPEHCCIQPNCFLTVSIISGAWHIIQPAFINPKCFSLIRVFTVNFLCHSGKSQFKSNVRETWCVILVSEADIFLSESLYILAERLSQSEIGLPLRQICYYSPPEGRH